MYVCWLFFDRFTVVLFCCVKLVFGGCLRYVSICCLLALRLHWCIVFLVVLCLVGVRIVCFRCLGGFILMFMVGLDDIVLVCFGLGL